MAEMPRGNVPDSERQSKLPGGRKVAGAGCVFLVFMPIVILFLLWLVGYLPAPLANWYKNVGP